MPELIGDRKQSTVDAEKLLSTDVAKFFTKEGYEKEAYYVHTVANWHKATDGRGETQEWQQQANQAMLKMVLDEWMPWHEDNPDFSFIDVNRRLKGICGFSAETAVEVTTNIVSQEIRRGETSDVGHPEHPRGSTTDDNECFFALLHRIARGQHVTLAEFIYFWRRLCLQFYFRMDKDLPFYVWTLNKRFTLDDLPSFDDVPEEENYIPRLDSLQRRRREDSTIVSGGKAVIPVQHARKLRERFHVHTREVADVPEELVKNIKEVLGREFVVE